MSKRRACLFAVVPNVFVVIGKHCRAGDRCRHGGSGEPGGNAGAVARVGELSARALALVALAVLISAACVGTRAAAAAGAARTARGRYGKACGSIAGERVVLRRVAQQAFRTHPIRPRGKCLALGHCRARSAVRVVHKLELGGAGVGFELALE